MDRRLEAGFKPLVRELLPLGRIFNSNPFSLLGTVGVDEVTGATGCVAGIGIIAPGTIISAFEESETAGEVEPDPRIG